MLTSRVSAHIAALVLVIGLCVPAASQAWNFGYRSSQGSHAYGGYGYRHQSPRYSYNRPPLTTGVITRRRGTGTISRSGRIGRTIGNLTTIPIIAGARTEPES